jgi:hypothetical protein
VPSAIHPVGAELAAQSWIGIINRSRAPDVWREARGIPGDALRVGRQVRTATPLLRKVAVNDALLRGRLITKVRTGRRRILGTRRIYAAHILARSDEHLVDG